MRSWSLEVAFSIAQSNRLTARSLSPIGAAVGALRVAGTVSTRIAVTLASMSFAVTVYLLTIPLAMEFIPGFTEGFEKYGP